VDCFFEQYREGAGANPIDSMRRLLVFENSVERIAMAVPADIEVDHLSGQALSAYFERAQNGS
jgi:hypothetical protein